MWLCGPVHMPLCKQFIVYSLRPWLPSCSTSTPQVCDFGISKLKDVSLAASSTRMQAGTPAYMPPEQFEGLPASDCVDVFAFAVRKASHACTARMDSRHSPFNSLACALLQVLLWECIAQQQPWRELGPMQIIFAVGVQVR
jgi:serine/threonine protein kinase